MIGVDVELGHGRQFEIPAEFESDIIENRLEKTPIPDLGFYLTRYIQGFRQNLQITELKLSLAVIKFCIIPAGMSISRIRMPMEAIFKVTDFLT